MGMKAEQWRQIILSFESKKTYNNPFLDVSILECFYGTVGKKDQKRSILGRRKYLSDCLCADRNRNVEL